MFTPPPPSTPAEQVPGGGTRRGASPVGIATRKPAGASSRSLRNAYFLIKVGKMTLILGQPWGTGGALLRGAV